MTPTNTETVSPEEKRSAGARLLAEGRFAEAAAILMDAFNEAPTSALANDCAVAEIFRGRAGEAEQAFRRALALDADNAKAAINFASLLAMQKRFGEAVRLLEKVAERLAGDDLRDVLKLLNGCRIQAAAVKEREARAELRDLAKQRQRPLHSDAAEESTDYWFPDITGWFSRAEALHLYTAIRLTRPDRILEIGTFFGRSTATICAAVKNLGSRAAFVTIDLDFRTREQAQKVFEEIHARDVVAPDELSEAFDLGFSTTEYAEYCVRKHGLAQYALFESGDFRFLEGQFDFIFADVLHDAVEIQKNLPAILRMLRSGGILAVHDLSEKNKETIQKIGGALEFVSNSETLGIFRERDQHPEPAG